MLPVVFWLWASLRLGHLKDWVQGWVPQSVFGLGNGVSLVELWFSTALDILEVLSGACGDQLHVMVADVFKSFDTVDRSILGCALGRLGLHSSFWKVYFAFSLSGSVEVQAFGGAWRALVPRCGYPPGLHLECGLYCCLVGTLVQAAGGYAHYKAPA